MIRPILSLVAITALSLSFYGCTEKSAPSDTTASVSPSPAPQNAVTSTVQTNKEATAEITSASAQDAAVKCRQDPLAGVASSSNLVLKEACKSAAGTIQTLKKASDGSFKIELKPDKEFETLLNDKNKTNNHGNVLVEVLASDAANIEPIKQGDHLSFTGALVQNKLNSSMEIRPAWIVNGQGSIEYKSEAAKTTAATDKTDNQKTDKQKTTDKTEKSTVVIFKHNQMVKRNNEITIQAKVTPGSMATLAVHYQGGVSPTSSSALTAKKADDKGNVSWTWKIDDKAPTGKCIVTVTTSLGAASSHMEVAE